jgi:hypothetical protein
LLHSGSGLNVVAALDREREPVHRVLQISESFFDFVETLLNASVV